MENVSLYSDLAGNLFLRSQLRSPSLQNQVSDPKNIYPSDEYIFVHFPLRNLSPGPVEW